MKYKILGLILIVGITYSCDMLDIDPNDSIPFDDVFTSKKGLDAALIGAYDVLQSASIAQDVVIFGDLAADNLIHVGTKKEYRQISDNRIIAENAYVEGLWNNSFEGINRVNNIFANIDLVTDITEGQKENYLAQCYFLRAYHYFNLVRFFGGVPIKLTPTVGASDADLASPRATETQTFEQIIDDLLLAEGYFNEASINSPAFANLGSTKALMAKVYLFMNDWTNAAIKANEVLNLGYELETSDYSSLFDESSSNNEIIFEINFYNDQDAVNGLADWMLPSGRYEVAAWDNYDKTSSIADAFNASDTRADITVKVTGDDSYANKYSDLLNDKDNVIVLRLADMYLTRAEALNEIAYIANGEAFNLLNEIRNRAGLADLTSVTAPNQAAFRLAIENERRLEFAFEGHRYFDLKRTGRIDDVLGDIGTLKEANWLYPIPQSELDTNTDPGMFQNDGY